MKKIISERDFGRMDARVTYFIRGAAQQNFGDYLPELIFKECLTYPKIDADAFRLVGSVIEDRWIRRDLRRVNGHVGGVIAYWCCGARRESSLSSKTLSHCRFFGVRGPLTRDLLNLPASTVLGDPGLLVPLLHRTSLHPHTKGKMVCMPHTHDRKSDDEMLRISGADVLIHPRVIATEAALRELMDKIASAGFLLTGSLHGAILACAFKRPFAFWDNGHVDIPFKWHDFAASINMPAIFVRNVAEGIEFYDSVAKKISVPTLTEILDVCPFVVRPSLLLRAMAYDEPECEPEVRSCADKLDKLSSFSRDEIFRLQEESADNRRARRNILFNTNANLWLLLRKLKSKLSNN
ncbi:polysaccharide pyruvyl transferase family protein [Sinorhizobium fredii]|uniref:Polysaccharide pyruvyl transferase family protein n=1 Tax=Rhizobium fredii TaxID=380 RepID=A0A2A6M770_RHIFR|nr:polysaccharide pyruvyl transferase family protein [Sinorhizobium fredii]PDT50410.1 polysaccharide pyruvyl transferase family protein [Sinorhizobium fredii]